MAWLVRIDDVSCVRETDAALLCIVDGEEHWIPKSQVHDDSAVFEAGHEGTLVVTQWIAEQKELEGEEYEGD
jgi:hypothetical protein